MRKEKIEAFFKSHPKVNVVFLTSDGFLFTLKSDAGLHAKTLKDATITPWHRTEAEKPEKVEAPKADTGSEGDDPENTDSKKAESTEAGSEGKDTDPDSSESEKTETVETKSDPLSEMTVAEVGEWAAGITDVAVLENGLKSVEFKGAKAAINARIAELTAKN